MARERQQVPGTLRGKSARRKRFIQCRRYNGLAVIESTEMKLV
jgi:hypothetical protein